MKCRSDGCHSERNTVCVHPIVLLCGKKLILYTIVKQLVPFFKFLEYIDFKHIIPVFQFVEETSLVLSHCRTTLVDGQVQVCRPLFICEVVYFSIFF